MWYGGGVAWCVVVWCCGAVHIASTICAVRHKLCTLHTVHTADCTIGTILLEERRQVGVLWVDTDRAAVGQQRQAGGLAQNWTHLPSSPSV